MAYSDQHFEDELREKLSQDTPLPPGMDWEAMRKGVHQKVEAQRKTKRPFLPWWRPGIGILLLLLAGLCGYQLRNASISQQDAPLKDETNIPDNPTDPTPEIQDATGSVLTDIESGTDSQQPEKEAGQLPQPSTFSPTNAAPEKDGPASAGLPTTNVQITTGKTNDLQKPDPVVSADNAVVTTKNAAEKVDASLRSEALPRLPFQQYTLIAEGEFLPDPEVKPALTTNEEQATVEAKGWFVDLVMGTQFASLDYEGDDSAYAALRSETAAALPGHHLAFSVGKNINEQWHIRSGLAYDRIRTLTEYEGMRTFDSTFLNVPLRVRVNGDTIFGAAALGVTEFREIQSFQREERLTVPILVGRNFQFGRSLLTLRAGPEFGLLIGSGGKVLTADRSVRLLTDDDFQRLTISARLEGELAVPLGAKWPLLIGRIGIRREFGGGQLEIRRTGGSVVGGLGIRWSL
ncbi:hypothetical protein FUA23_09365 [Neolewinella aurantiaca]|uniref:Outer membrane protein beta-barrel domain-containing protein n=1 Tax=Neolewinella aurantiaca TaxID=2602767 RepID=A0A5C7FPK3_9BACT|nr:hypothetical protein [Neolewinella aurantiaca]TXF89648.1 hypothetical protein FUA23_09365 [Neolewinella aurantiaca]